MLNEASIINKFMELQDRAVLWELWLDFYKDYFFLVNEKDLVIKNNLHSLDEVRIFLEGYEAGYNARKEE